MNKTQILSELKKLNVDLSNLISSLETSQVMKTEGKLQCRTRGSSIEYYHIMEEKPPKYISKENRALAENLAWKELAEKTIETAKKEQAEVEKCIKILQEGKKISDIDLVRNSLHAGVRRLVGTTKLTNDAYAIDWVKERQKSTNRKKPLNGDLITINKEAVKSKSELIIADRLFLSGVPYVYEPILTFDDGFHFIYPDFLVLNKRTREEFLWEHLGKVDDDKYAAKNQLKIEDYGKNGFFPGKNLILTFESSARNISTEYIDSLIRNLLV